MSELLSAIEGFRAGSLPELPDARTEQDFAELHRVAELIELEHLRRLAEIDRRRLFERDGHLSAASWLVSVHGVGHGTARAATQTARALEEMPATRRGIESGEVSLSAARVLVVAPEADPEAFSRSEPLLVEAARFHQVGDLRRVAAYWREACERERGLDLAAHDRAGHSNLHQRKGSPGDAPPVEKPLDGKETTPMAPAVSLARLRKWMLDRVARKEVSGPHTWCDAHHVVHWAGGGPTTAANLLLCRPHHRLVHRPGGFRLGMIDGRPVFRRPDGSVLQERAPS